jgi:hypothetical protein
MVLNFDLSRLSVIGRTAIIVDNAPCHNIFESTKLKNVDLIFFPPNTASVLQPNDQGIIYLFKSFYKGTIYKINVFLVEIYRMKSKNKEIYSIKFKNKRIGKLF